MLRVLVTRPAPLSERTARRLAGMGHAPVVLPLTGTRPVEVEPGLVRADAGAVAVTSATALLSASPDLLRELSRLPCMAVGGATASAARAAGFGQVSEGPGDAAGLARSIVAGGSTAPVIYLCGRLRRADFERVLGRAGVEVTPVETYDTVTLPIDEGGAASAIGGAALDAALLYSANAAQALDELAGRPALSGAFRDTAYCCLSGRIASALVPRTGRKILVAAEPTEEALLSLLAKRGGRLHHPSSFLAPVV